MYKLLVDGPSGKQEIISVSDTGGYFDTSRILWDERIDGELPAITQGGMVRNGDILGFDQAKKDAEDALVEVPASVEMWQAQKALVLASISLASVVAAIAAIEDDMEREFAQIDWAKSNYVYRASALVASITQALGLNDAKVDQLFITASQLTQS